MPLGAQYPVGEMLSYITFDSSGLQLHAEIGTFELDLSSASITAQNIVDRERLRRYDDDYDLSSDNTWIMRNSGTLIWLPSGVSSICVGHSSIDSSHWLLIRTGIDIVLRGQLH